MGKSKKKRRSTQERANGGYRDTNPLLTAQRKFITSLPKKARSHFFSPAHITPEQRAEIWENQADLGEKLVDSCAWATPDPRLLPVFKHFGPIVEVGCGANAVSFNCFALSSFWNHPLTLSHSVSTGRSGCIMKVV